jgi:hypothetical protein
LAELQHHSCTKSWLSLRRLPCPHAQFGDFLDGVHASQTTCVHDVLVGLESSKEIIVRRLRSRQIAKDVVTSLERRPVESIYEEVFGASSNKLDPLGKYVSASPDLGGNNGSDIATLIPGACLHFLTEEVEIVLHLWVRITESYPLGALLLRTLDDHTP